VTVTESQSLLDHQLDEMYKKVRSESATLEKSARWRRWGAYSLKFVAVDTVLANHDRLIANTEAHHAYRALGDSVKYKYGRDASGLIEKLKLSPDDAKAKAALESLKQRANDELVAGLTKVADFRHKQDVGALRKLSLDLERQGAKSTA
jgi:hypothetical protein